MDNALRPANMSYQTITGFGLLMFVMACVTSTLSGVHVLLTFWTGSALHFAFMPSFAGQPLSVLVPTAAWVITDAVFNGQASSLRPRELKYALIDLMFSIWRLAAVGLAWLTVPVSITAEMAGVAILVAILGVWDLVLNQFGPMFRGEWRMLPPPAP